MLRIIDNKRIDLTDEEWRLYQEICKSYDQERLGIKGEELFKGLFETDKNGVIIFLRPPTSKFSSMEAYMFLISVMVHQHVGTACDHVDNLATTLAGKIKEANEVINRGNELIEEMKKNNNSFEGA